VEGELLPSLCTTRNVHRAGLAPVGYPRRRSAGAVRRRASPRLRRRIGFVLAALVVAGGIVGALIIGDTAQPPLPLTNRPTIVEKERKSVRLSAADRRAILAVSTLFIRTAVRRDHPERAWPLASAALRTGTTLADWKAGTLPFAPFPVSGARWSFAYSVVGEVGLDVLVESTDPEIRPLVNRLTLVSSTRPSGPAWLVDGWTPMSSAPGGFVDSPPVGSMAVAAMSDRSTPQPSKYWVLAPFGVLLAALALPLAILANSRRAERRVRRRRAAARRQD
jgi:hypothetical protein